MKDEKMELINIFLLILSGMMFTIFGAMCVFTFDDVDDENFNLYIISIICMFIAGISIIWFLITTL